MATETEHKLPEAARSNPYSKLSREELDAAFTDVKQKLDSLSNIESPTRKKLERQRQAITAGYTWLMVREGLADWDGGKPKGSEPPIEIGAGPLGSDLVHEMRS